MKFKEFENKERCYWGVDIDSEPDSAGYAADIEVEAIKGFEYPRVNGEIVDHTPLRIWYPARVHWRANAWGDPDEAFVFAEQLRMAWIKALAMDVHNGLRKGQ